MGCAYSKPEVDEKQMITIDQLEKELFKFNNNIRGYWKRKKTFCLRRVKPKNNNSHVPVDEEKKRPRKYQEEKQACASALPKTQESTSKEIKQDGAPRLLRSVYSKTAPIRIQGWFSLESMPPATKSLPLRERELSSEPSHVTAADVVQSPKSVQHIQDECSEQQQLHVDYLYHPTKHYDFLKEIGRGTYGKVYLAHHKENQDEEYAIKCISLEDSYTEFLAIELEILRKCKHKNILTMTGSYLTNDSLFIVTEYVPGVSLRTLSSEMNLTEKVIASIMKECLQGLAYLHQHQYIHCDLKSENILIGIDRRVKIADFGLAVRKNDKRPPGFRGTQVYTSPEMANHLPYGKEIDIWGLGIVAIEMVQGYPPLAVAGDLQSFITMSESGYTTMNEEAASKVSEAFKDFVYNGALKHNPADRLSAKELLKHPFMSHGDDCQSLPAVVALLMKELIKRKISSIMKM